MPTPNQQMWTQHNVVRETSWKISRQHSGGRLGRQSLPFKISTDLKKHSDLRDIILEIGSSS
jgi:hypothetical protein